MFIRFLMEIIYKLFKREAVGVGDIFWVGVGGFTIQPTRVFEADENGFSYRNEKFVIRFNYRGDFLDGMLEKQVENGLERYVSKEVLERVREVMPSAKIEE